MLVLARQKNEAIMIGNDIEIKIIEIKGGNVRIGISAPSDIPVHRKEIFQEILNENISASRSEIPDDIKITDKKQKSSMDNL
ncbi:MAG: carbon storage regulator [Deltaproteobacteria bacterium]|nr:MAG: carbon storage regulator [Deltaproteobacteria bacterium]PIE75012.1 MAG: carbon storage regulator [Deltaproteobacteria bacterium]